MRIAVAFTGFILSGVTMLFGVGLDSLSGKLRAEDHEHHDVASLGNNLQAGLQLASNRLSLHEEEALLASESRLLPANVKSLLNVTTPLEHGDYVWDDSGELVGPLAIWIDLRRQLISVYRGGTEIGTAVIVYGAPDMESPTGRFQILSKIEDYRSRAYDAPMPYAMFITHTGIALHGSPMSAHHATHGCIGLPPEFARLLFDVAKTGDVVEIVRSSPEIGAASDNVS